MQIIDHLKKIPTELPDQNFGQNCSKKAKNFQKSQKNFKKTAKGKQRVFSFIFSLFHVNDRAQR